MLVAWGESDWLVKLVGWENLDRLVKLRNGLDLSALSFVLSDACGSKHVQLKMLK